MSYWDMQKITLTNNKFALVDDKDYDWVKPYKWFLSTMDMLLLK